jgi:putative ABC transport system substrate-binding protein
LRAALRELGYFEGKNITIESRYSENRLDRLPALAEELVRHKPDVIVAGGRNDTRAARNATRTIPIIGQSLLDPVADGLLDSLARPGGNVTGFTPIADVLVGKRLELIKETVANLSRVVLLWNPQDPGSARQWKESQTAARELGLQLRSIEASSTEQLDGVQRSKSDTERRSRDDIECVRQCSSKMDRGLGGKESDPAIYHQGSLWPLVA